MKSLGSIRGVRFIDTANHCARFVFLKAMMPVERRCACGFHAHVSHSQTCKTCASRSDAHLRCSPVYPFVIGEMIAEVLTKRVLFVACDLLASTPLILQRQKRMIS